LGPLELEIRRVPGVLACQFTATDVLVLVEPTADAAAVTATVSGLLAAAAESRRVAVIGGTAAAAASSAGALWWLRKHHVAVAGATVATFLAAAGAAAMTGTFSGSDGRVPHRVAAPAPTTTTTLPPQQGSSGPPPTSPQTTTTTVPAGPTPTTAPPATAQIIRVALPAPLPRSVSVPATTATTEPSKPPTTNPPPTTPPPPPPGPKCDPAHVVTSFHFLDNGQSLSDLRQHVSSGDRVTAVFTLANGCQGARVALVSHTMPDPVFVKAHVDEQVIFDSARANLSAGEHTLGPVRVPDCWFQIDFAVLGGGPGTPGFTYSSATGGTRACETENQPRAVWHGADRNGGLLPAKVDETGESRTR
jgi:hypothetical protein